MKVAVIGAGAAGLCAAQYLSSNSSISFAVYEQTGNVGGTWVYNESTGVDEFGLPIHSSMYKNLRTNLPKETMEFLTFKFNHEKSFVPRADVLKYLSDFADCYQLNKYIKFHHHVTKVSPKDSNWEVSVKNLKTNEIEISCFDAVMVCNGHFSQPRFPEIPGMDKFKEAQIHSHDYREPQHFCGKNVVIIGSGPSGIDITFDIASFTKNVYFSHHNAQLLSQTFPENVIHKPDVVSLSENSVIFQDGTSENVDAVVYCTGYHYKFPFLSEECHIRVEDNFVQPLYKHLINIHHPSMCFIGIPWQSLIFPLFDLQVRCFINVLLNKVKVPSCEEMLLSLKADTDERKRKGQKPRYYHKLGSTVYEYMENLATTFNVTPIPKVVHSIYESARERKRECLHSYREDLFQVIDDYNYICHQNKGS